MKRDPCMSPEGFDFKASRGWFDKFKKRGGINSVVRHDGPPSSVKAAVDKYELI